MELTEQNSASSKISDRPLIILWIPFIDVEMPCFFQDNMNSITSSFEGIIIWSEMFYFLTVVIASVSSLRLNPKYDKQSII